MKALQEISGNQP